MVTIENFFKKLLTMMSWCIIVIAITINVSALPTNADLLHYYPLENCTQGGIDAKGTYNLGGIVSDPSISNGIVGNGCYFDGNDYLRNITTTMPDASSIRTIEYWYNMSTSAKCEIYIGSTTWLNNMTSIWGNPTTTYGYGGINGTTYIDGTVTQSHANSQNKYAHYILVMNGTHVWFFYNGVRSANFTKALVPSTEFKWMGLGANLNAYDGIIVGHLDNVVLWSKPFDNNDAIWSYNNGSGRNYTAEFITNVTDACIYTTGSWIINNTVCNITNSYNLSGNSISIINSTIIINSSVKLQNYTTKYLYQSVMTRKLM